MEPAQIATASVPKIDSREWLPGNPWSWSVLGLSCCSAAWLLLALLGPSLSALRHGLIVAGLLSVGAALAMRWHFSPSYLGRISRPWRGLALLGLSAIFHFLAVGMSVLLFLAFLGPEVAYSWRWGPVLVCWIVVAPMSAIAGVQCYRRIRQDEALSGREEAALLLLLAALTCQVAVGAMYDRARPGDLATIRFFLGVVTLIAVAAAPLVLVPQTVRRTVVSLLIVMHFTSVGAAALLAVKGSIVIHQLISRLSRPYLNFFVLANPHSYFVEESPPSRLWFRIVFADGGQEWQKVPDVDGKGRHGLTSMNLTRYQGLVQHITFASPPSLFEMDASPRDFFRLRLEAANPANEKMGGTFVPFLNESEVLVAQQCLFPSTTNVPRLLKAYVLHVVNEAQQDGRRVKAVKVYRVKHRFLSLPEYLKGVKEPWDPDTYVAVFMGDFDAQGNPLNLALPDFFASTVGLMGTPMGAGPWLASSAAFSPRPASDPLLYWMLPTVRAGSPQAPTFRCYFRKHAGDPAWIRNTQGQWVEDEPKP